MAEEQLDLFPETVRPALNTTVAYITMIEGKYFINVTFRNQFVREEIPLSAVCRLGVEATEHMARHVKGVYIPQHHTTEPPIEGKK